LGLERGASVGSVNVTHDTALRHSAVWAGLRLRANLLSSLPVDIYRRAAGVNVEVPKGPFFTAPDKGWTLGEWMWATQYDLDRYGNTVGIVREKDALGKPMRVELVAMGSVTLLGKGPVITGYRVTSTTGQGEVYDPEDIWHERQYRIAGSPVGLDPIAYAAWSIGTYLSAQDFALDYFAAGGQTSGTLRNTQVGELSPPVLAEAKAKYKAATERRDIFVTGKDWEFKPAEAVASADAFLDSKAASVVEVARYLDVPVDMIDGAVSGQSITYANISQRNLQMLVTSLGPAIKRREDAMSAATPMPRFVKLNADALLRMDPETRERLLIEQVKGRTRAPSEARELADLEPFTPDQLAEFDRLFGKPKSTPDTAATGAQ
jgi:HK97 family phage portal protein